MDVTPGLNYDRAQISLAFLVQLMGDMEKPVLVDRTVSEPARVPESLTEHTHLRLDNPTASRRFRCRHHPFFYPRQEYVRTSYKAEVDGNTTWELASPTVIWSND